MQHQRLSFSRLVAGFGLSLTLTCLSVAQADVLGRQAEPRPNAPSVAETSSVRSLYVLHCAGCHGMDGSGANVAQMPDLRRLRQFLHLAGGREFIIKVPGVMGSGLSDREVAQVTNWVFKNIALTDTPADASAPLVVSLYDESEVRRARATPLVDVVKARQQLIQQARARGIALE